MRSITRQLDAVSAQTTAVKDTANELKVSRKKTWRSIAFITAITVLDILATVFAYEALTNGNRLISQVICPTNALFLHSYTPTRGATYPGGLVAYKADMHSIYIQYAVTLHCSPTLPDPTIR